MRSRSLLGTMFSNWVNICHTHNVMATATVMVIARNSLCILAFITTYATVDMIQPIHTSLNIQRLAFLLFAIDNNQMKFWQKKDTIADYSLLFGANTLSTCHQ